MSQRRAHDRKSMLRQAQLSETQDALGVMCVIRDASEYGCRIYCRDLDSLPDTVYLQTRGVEVPIKCTMAWRQDGCAGLRFA